MEERSENGEVLDWPVAVDADATLGTCEFGLAETVGCGASIALSSCKRWAGNIGAISQVKRPLTLRVDMN